VRDEAQQEAKMSVIAFLLFEVAICVGAKAIVNKYPADPQLLEQAERERLIDVQREYHQDR
jgi:hypothetical protein